MMRNEKKPLDFVIEGIHASYRPLIAMKLDKILKRATKKGLDGLLTYEISDTYVVESKSKMDEVPVKTSMIDVTVKGEVPKINGWEFVGKLTHDGVGEFVTVLAAPTMEVPKKFRKSKGTCDHCKTARYRKDTFVISKDEKFMEIGRSCLKDFFPTVNIEWVVNYFKYVADMIESGDFEDYDSIKSPKFRPTADLELILMVTNAVIRKDGWMSGTAAKTIMENDPDAMVSPTSWTVESVVALKSGLRMKYKNEKELVLTAKDEEIAPKVIDFVRNKMYGDNDYVYNMKNFFSNDIVDMRYIPFIASAVSAYTRSIEKEAEMKVMKGVSNFVGTIGDKITADVEVLAAKWVSSYYGSSLLVRMVDDVGNTFTTFYSGYKFEPKVGDKFTIKGTVKAHKEFKGWKNTMLTRVKMV
jgi:hypothetical protein